MDLRLLSIIVCPICNGKLFFNKIKRELVCKFDSLAFPIRNGIPVLLTEKARKVIYF